MKAALIMSGYLRGFRETLPNIQKNIIDKFDSVDVYVHITKNELQHDRYYNPSNLDDDLHLIEEKLNPICLLIENNIIDNNSLYNNWSKLYKLNQMRVQNEILMGEKYDVVIRFRPDMNILSSDLFCCELDNVLYIPKDAKIDKNKLIRENDNYICDIFCFGKSDIMTEYFNFYNNLDELVNKYGVISETLMFNYLVHHKIPYDLIDVNYDVILSKCNIFGISGDSGSGKTTLANNLKLFFSNSFILEGDRYHKWERGSDNWETLTHLNPTSNYISKMHDDVFNLKLGKSIYQVDYDHKTGKFTEPEFIPSNETIILCGLHSNYQPNEYVYNLQIFMDTDPVLKTKWKLHRDVIERGHSEQNVLKQIRDRQEDYVKYILPQRASSDLIVNYFSNQFDNLCLRLYINNKFDVSSLLTAFSIVEPVVSHEEGFITFTFNEYKYVELWNRDDVVAFNNFYDYIIFSILHINNLRN